MAGQIQIGGLASGLDTAAIISALVQAEGIPINALESQKKTSQSKLNLVGTLEGLVNKLQSTAKKFADAPNFLKNSVTIEQEGVASFVSNGGSGLGTYSLEVLSLASIDRWSFSAVSDAEADLGGAEVSFDYDGQSYAIDLAPGSSSLNDLAEAINQSAAGKVKASVIQAGTSSNPQYTLVLEGEDTGADFEIANLAVTSGTPSFDVDLELSDAKNAEIKLNGLTIVRESNTIQGAVPGLTIELQGTTSAATEFTVGLDTEGIVGSLKEFVAAYNAVTGFIGGQSQFSEEDGPSGALFGDPLLRTIGSSIRNALFGSQNVDSTSSFGSLGLIGIKLNVDGSLTLDEAKVKEKLSEDPQAFEDFFVDLDGFDNGGLTAGTPGFYTDTTSDSGVFMQLEKALASLLDKQVLSNGTQVDGLLGARKSTLQKDIKRFDDSISDLESRLELFEESLVKKFASLEQVLSGLQAQQVSLTALTAQN
jgi:flagellar hook-associated protein 2